MPMCHPQVCRSRQLRRHNEGNALTSQDNREWLRALPRNPLECGNAQGLSPFPCRQIGPTEGETSGGKDKAPDVPGLFANVRGIRRRPSGVAYVCRALPFDTTIVSTTVLSGRCVTSFRLMNRPVSASRATVFPAVCGVFAMVLAPLSKVAFTGDTWILGALSVRAAHRFTGGLPRTDGQPRISRMRSVGPRDGEHHPTHDRNGTGTTILCAGLPLHMNGECLEGWVSRFGVCAELLLCPPELQRRRGRYRGLSGRE